MINVCPKCKILSTTDKYCTKCGIKMEEAEKCSNCDNFGVTSYVLPGSVFCGECGRPVK